MRSSVIWLNAVISFRGRLPVCPGGGSAAPGPSTLVGTKALAHHFFLFPALAQLADMRDYLRTTTAGHYALAFSELPLLHESAEPYRSHLRTEALSVHGLPQTLKEA